MPESLNYSFQRRRFPDPSGGRSGIWLILPFHHILSFSVHTLTRWWRQTPKTHFDVSRPPAFPDSEGREDRNTWWYHFSSNHVSLINWGFPRATHLISQIPKPQQLWNPEFYLGWQSIKLLRIENSSYSGSSKCWWAEQKHRGGGINVFKLLTSPRVCPFPMQLGASTRLAQDQPLFLNCHLPKMLSSPLFLRNELIYIIMNNDIWTFTFKVSFYMSLL